MKTLKAFIEKTNIPAKLVRAVVRQCGGWTEFKELAFDVAKYGASGGTSGFIYYAETVPFTKCNLAAILQAARDLADSIGEGNEFDLIAGFNGLRGEFTGAEIAKAIYSPRDEGRQTVFNALAWFALEIVAQAYCDALEA